MVQLASTVWRDFNVAGIPSSGKFKPEKERIRQLLTFYESLLMAAQYGNTVWFATRAAMNADLAHALGVPAVVYADTTAANNGIYIKAGASGVGSWGQIITYLPGYQFVTATDAGAGTANAIVATSAPLVTYTDGVQLIRLNIFEANTATSVTVAFDGGAALTIQTASGNAPAVGGLTAGMTVLGVVDQTGTVFRMLSDQSGAAIQAAAEDAATLAEAWAEGTEPGGVGTKSAKEWSQVAEAATTFNRVAVQFTTIATGPYDMGVGNTIGTANNLDVKIGGVLQDHDLYTVSGTTFTLLNDPGAGLEMEAVLTAEIRSLAAPADGSVSRLALDVDLNAVADKVDLIDVAKLDKIITVDDYGVVYDNSPADRALMHDAAMAAVAAGVPFVVPNRGLVWNEGLVIQVPEDFATVQEAHDAMLNWIIPATAPKYVDTTQNHISPVSVTISVSGIVHTHNLVNITWNHPAGNRIRLKGRGKTGLTFASQQALTYASGTHPCRLRFTDWPATDPAVGSVIMPIVLTGSGAYQNFEGGWRITVVDNVNKDITFAAYAKTDTSALTATIGGGLFYHLPCVLRFTNFISSGADAGCIDVHTTLRMSDIAILGSPSNASTTNGLIARAGAEILLEQHCAILEHQRSGLWLLNDAHAQVGYSSFCGNNSGINNLQSVVDGSRTYIQGNTAYNLICGIGSTNSIVLSAFGGSGGAGILVNGNASFIGSGHSRRSDLGIDVKPGGFANINDMNVRANVTWDLRRRGGGRLMLTSSDYGTTDPAIDTGDSYGGFTALSATLDAVT